MSKIFHVLTFMEGWTSWFHDQKERIMVISGWVGKTWRGGERIGGQARAAVVQEEDLMTFHSAAGH